MLILVRLENILHILRSKQIGDQSNEDDHGILRKAPSNARGHNRFASLILKEDVDEQRTEVKDKAPETTLMQQRSINNEFALEDDDLGEWIELSFVLYVSHVSPNKTDARYSNILQRLSTQFWTSATSIGRRRRRELCPCAWLRGFRAWPFPKWVCGMRN